MSEITRKVGRRIAALRKRAGLTQEALAQALGTVPEVVSRIERGTSSPSLERIQEITNALRAEPHELFASDEPVASDARDAALARLHALLRGRSSEEIAMIADVAERILRRPSTRRD